MTREEFKKNAEQAIGYENYCLSDQDLDLLVAALYDPDGKTWTYNDFYHLAETVWTYEGDVYDVLRNYNINWSLYDPKNMKLFEQWLDDHPQAMIDIVSYIIRNQKKGGN